MRKASSIQQLSTNLGRVFVHILAWAFLILQCNTLDWQWQFYTSVGEQANFFWPSVYGMFFNALVFYLHALWLYPRRKKLSLPYWLMVLLTLAVASFLEALFDHWYCNLEQNAIYLELIAEMQTEGIPNKEAKTVLIFGMAIENTGVHLLFWLLSFAYILPRQSLRSRQIQSQIEEEKIKAELQFLKAQINPHFLFNGLNSIYHLIDRSPDLAKDITLQFSSLLRYQIYDCQAEKIYLEKEISYLKSYFALEKVRRGADVEISLTVPDPLEVVNVQIAPLIFTPFIENAFKYVSQSNDEKQDQVRAVLTYINNKLTFQIDNTIDSNKPIISPDKASGLGLSNVKKRLALQYPDQYHLIINPMQDRFSVSLQIEVS